MSLRTFTARALIVDAQRLFEGGGVIVDERGEIVSVLEGHDAVRRGSEGEVLDLGDGVLAPGWVNAHAHLELTGLEGRVPAGAVFPDWIKALLGERAGLTAEDFDLAVERGADRLLRGGTTTVGDVDSTGASERVLGGHPLRAVIFREAVDLGDEERRREVMRSMRAPLLCEADVSLGVSPHAGYTVSDELLQSLADSLESGAGLEGSRLPVQTHWNETSEEVDWERGAPSAFDGLVMECSGRSTLERLDMAELLQSPVSLVHANHPAEGDAALLRERGAVIVHCPGAHEWFERPEFNAEGWWSEGVEVALGTDSLAGNDALDMAREVALFRRAHPGASPARAFDMATRVGARALGLEGRVGELGAGACADMVLHHVQGDALEAITSGESQVSRLWISGKELSPDRGCDQ